MQILKKNDFKIVKLHKNDKQWTVEKSFTAFSVEQQRKNAQYLYDALLWFYQEFHSIITIPKVERIDLDKRAVFMEYLADLPSASRMSFRSIVKAKTFFDHCYQIHDYQGFLRDTHGSIAATPCVQVLLDGRFPVSLGFKGDLRENLVIGCSGEVILADIDSIALEPLGLSELALYAELISSFSPHNLLSSFFYSLPAPVAYFYLNKLQASQLNTAAVELISINMRNLSSLTRAIKIKRALSLLERLAWRHYSR